MRLSVPSRMYGITLPASGDAAANRSALRPPIIHEPSPPIECPAMQMRSGSMSKVRFAASISWRTMRSSGCWFQAEPTFCITSGEITVKPWPEAVDHVPCAPPASP